MTESQERIPSRLEMLGRVWGEYELQTHDPKALWREQDRTEHPDTYHVRGYGDFLKRTRRNLATALLRGANGTYQLYHDLEGKEEVWGAIERNLYGPSKHAWIRPEYTRWVTLKAGVQDGVVKWKGKPY